MLRKNINATKAKTITDFGLNFYKMQPANKEPAITPKYKLEPKDPNSKVVIFKSNTLKLNIIFYH